MESCVENGGGVSGGGGVESIGESVGGLVWVRRRNGSWWPGQIVKPDELPKGVVVPVRSGTAVKLLGHTDISLDWYNLEKSKRVKPFRCGEYDVYIERAKATADTNRKAAKYARRNDAIVEALQIENTCLGRGPLEFCSRVNVGSRRRKSARKPSSTSHGRKGEYSDSQDSSDSLVDLSHSREKSVNGRGLKVKAVILKRQRTPDDSEDDLSEGYKRMRGLEDLGLGVVSGNAVVGGEVDLVHQGSNSLFDSHGCNLISKGSPVNGSRASIRRRSLVAHGHETSKRKDRRRPLAKVLENTAMVTVPVTCELEPDGSKQFSLIKGAEVSSMPTLAENHYLDSLYDVPFVVEEKDSAGITKPRVGRQYNKNCQAEALMNDRVSESALDSSVDVNSSSPQFEERTSKWQSKGKRNSRQLSKDRKSKSDMYMDIDEDDVNLAGVELSDEFSLDLVEKVGCNGLVRSLSAHNSDEPVKSKAEFQLDGFQDWGTQISHRNSTMRGLASMLPPPVEESPPPQKSLPYRHSRNKTPSRYRDPDSPSSNLHSNSLMFDVSVRVDPYYRPQHPLVSLTSNLNGKSIIGHPLTVDMLDDSIFANQEIVDSEATTPTNVNMGYALETISEAGKLSKRILALRQHKSNYKSLMHRRNGLQPKTRKLSSLTGRKLSVMRNLILENCEGLALACVPVRVVFSRISNALKGNPRGPRLAHARNTETE